MSQQNRLVISRPVHIAVAIVCIILVLVLTKSTMRSADEYQTSMLPRDVVLAFSKMAFDEHQPEEAVLQYFSPDVIDHNPNIAGTRESIIAHLEALEWATEGPSREIKHMITQGDYVVVHHHLKREPGTAGIAAVEIFRVANGLIVEHWDVLQSVPENTINPQPMFGSESAVIQSTESH